MLSIKTVRIMNWTHTRKVLDGDMICDIVRDEYSCVRYVHTRKIEDGETFTEVLENITRDSLEAGIVSCVSVNEPRSSLPPLDWEF